LRNLTILVVGIIKSKWYWKVKNYGNIVDGSVVDLPPAKEAEADQEIHWQTFLGLLVII